MSQNPKFTHLHLHTEYSLLDGANKLKDLVKEVKRLGMDSVAMTDHGNMFGAIDFYQTMQSEGIKPIIGMEGYLHNSEDLADRSTRQRFHICLYAKDMVGYKNLMYLSSQAYIEGFYYYPRINKKLLKDHSEGLICSSACLQGEINWHLNTNEKNRKFGAKGYERAKEIALEYKEIFGDDFYLEIMRHGIDDQYRVDDKIIQIAKETGIKIVATNDTHYLKKDYADPHEAFMCIAMNKQYDDPARLRHSVHEFFLKSPQQMAALFADIPEAIENTQEIVNKCNLELKLGDPTPPNFKFVKEYAQADGVSYDNDVDYFIYRCKEGLKQRLKLVDEDKHPIYWDRLQKEMDIINDMKFPGYMLIVWDFVRECEELDPPIPIGPGRGSAAGSLVAYALRITNIDPLKYDLLFERFLNPERVSMPDIDMDFCQARRGEIIDYVVKKYGRYNVAQVITFGSLLAKGVIRDVGRVLGLPYSKADAMAKLIPDELGINLKAAYEKEPKIKELIQSDNEAARVWEFAQALEGLKRNPGMHAAGVVISNEELWHKTPLYKPSGEQTLVTQYSLNYLEDVDLIKFDFLGLKTLDVVDNAKRLIEDRYNKELDINNLTMDDPKVYEMICSGKTLGMFQIESDGMQDLNRRLRPSNFEDLIAVLALYRPGPMESGMLDDFIDRKHGKEPISYFFEEFEDVLKPILEPTYGVIVYQEQVMQIVQAIGGFSLGESDIVRRAMGKKKVDLMAKYNEEFSQRAAKRGYSKENASQLFNLIEKFAGYGFNKSHSAAYAMITYQTAWLKTHYPQEFMAALLTSEQDNTDKIVKYVDEVKRLGITLLPPDINRSIVEFSATTLDGENVILFGLGAVKGLGKSAVNPILHARQEGGMFEDMNDFLSRVNATKVNKKAYESLIKSGAFDRFEYNRKTMLDNIEQIVHTAATASKLKADATNSLFGDDDSMTMIELKLENSAEFDLKTILEFEKATLGFYVSGHPLDEFREVIDGISYTLSSDLENIEDGQKALFIGKVEKITEKVSKKGNKFGILQLMDFHGDLEVMLFADFLEKLQNMNLDKPIAIKTTINKDDQFTRIRVEKIMDINEAKKSKIATKKIEAPAHPVRVLIELNDDASIIEKLHSLALEHKGNRALEVVIKSKLANAIMQTDLKVSDLFVQQVNEKFYDIFEIE